jgi:hypothetical protein
MTPMKQKKSVLLKNNLILSCFIHITDRDSLFCSVWGVGRGGYVGGCVIGVYCHILQIFEEEFEDIKGVIRILRSKKVRQCNC